MMKALIELLKIKSIITLAMVYLFIVMVLNGMVDGAIALTIISNVLTYYFVKDRYPKAGD